MATFRVFMQGNGYVDIDPERPDVARKQAAAIYPGCRITKVKLLREKSDG